MTGDGETTRSTIEALLGRLAAELSGVEIVPTGEVIEYQLGGVVFTAAAGGAIELRLGEEIADAAARTPSTSISGRGPAWVRFAPPQWDRRAIDRLDAWFRVAWRAAGRSRSA